MGVQRNNNEKQLLDLLNYCFDNNIEPWNNQVNKETVKQFLNKKLNEC